jgi:hypothetical protein
VDYVIIPGHLRDNAEHIVHTISKALSIEHRPMISKALSIEHRPTNSKALGIEHRPKFCSSSPAMVTSLYK